MRFHDKAKRNLFRFIAGITKERSIFEIKDCIVSMTKYQNFDDYFSNTIESITSTSEDWDTEMKYSRIRSDLAIVAGLYYGRDLSLKHLEKEYKIDITREKLKEEITKFTRHILFGKKESGVEKVGDLQIEKEGLVPIMDRLIASGKPEQEQKNELKEYLRVYGILSEISLREAEEAANRDPAVILARNTYQNRHISATGSSSSFVEKVGGSKKSGDKSVGFH